MVTKWIEAVGIEARSCAFRWTQTGTHFFCKNQVTQALGWAWRTSCSQEAQRTRNLRRVARYQALLAAVELHQGQPTVVV